MKIMIVGPGGIGGFLCGMLARMQAEVTLVARGRTLAAIEQNGVTIQRDSERFTVHPTVTDLPEEFGVQDAIFLCTKAYDLYGAIEQIRPVVGPGTLVIPLLNGVSAPDTIASKLSEGIICGGSIYIYSRIDSPGVIIQSGDLNRVVVGIPGKAPTEALVGLAKLLTQAGVPCEASEDIRRDMWMKWSFILSNAQATSYYDMNVGQLREHPEGRKFLISLLEELVAVAKAEGIRLPDTLIADNIRTIDSMPYEGRSSLSRDLAEPGKNTELSLFAGTLVPLADKHGIQVPCNKKILEKFGDRL